MYGIPINLNDEDYDSLKESMILMLKRNVFTFDEMSRMLLVTVQKDCKKCKLCNIYLPKNEFKEKTRYCLKCHSVRQSEFYLKNKEKYWHYQKTGKKRGPPKKEVIQENTTT